ncbi:NCS2 family permease [Haloferax mediterranei ATCC 33500]|uniref:NCS2 family permease n=1 Tax=Haloferax mediterranei (strain ATCC 33500 / DSM 1411 / JCM 8866 / NBRC 14739 / NCIMB 2177 / R-4) TaxID=523841 RepID=I3R1E9_HALMT|nr:NCS2 family permease [Haloferax mediterranei]AFK18059.1 transporter [Haloferax mediterranei ATCC 33500]AHZ22528.1 uracil permease [Haloferax mediterranei ATCC 33500]EMA02665.1 transporter [Haloferax mediterranei ATCC 33500]MDX5988152.1 NCS2 family permease [Haloferax mediterranei ATCC 33500]QCQ74599.1 NCS2 family permease [Haloferax mediterranei ATCC 33500]
MGLSETLANYFDVHKHGSTVKAEILAGITTFLTMSYIVVVNPDIMTGIPGAKPGIIIDGYTPGQVESMLVVVTILAAAIATLTMAFYANRPFAQAPGLGLNAFFAFTVVGALGISWQTALAAVFVEGLLFIVLTAVGAREAIIKIFPHPVKMAVGTGIGLFLAIIGLQAMGIVVDDTATLVTLGSLASNPVAIVSVVGLFMTFVLYAADVPGSILLGIALTTVLGWAVTQLGLVGLDAGLVVAAGTTAVTLPVIGTFDLVVPGSGSVVTYNITPLAGSFISGFGNVEAFSFALIVFTFFFVDFFDTAGTLVGVGQVAGFLDDNGDLPDIDKPLMADAVGTTAGAALGTSTVTTYIESASGVEEGGRTGLTALVTAGLFLASLALVPLATAIPLYASHIALVVIGVVMLRNVVDIAWDDITHTIPAGMTILIMPFTYSIAYGIASGIISYPLVKLAAGEYDDISAGQWALAVAFFIYFVVRTSGMLQAQV